MSTRGESAWQLHVALALLALLTLALLGLGGLAETLPEPMAPRSSASSPSASSPGDKAPSQPTAQLPATPAQTTSAPEPRPELRRRVAVHNPSVTMQAVDLRGAPVADVELAMKVSLRTPSGSYIDKARSIGRTSGADGSLTRTLDELQAIAGAGAGFALAKVRVGSALLGCEASFVDVPNHACGSQTDTSRTDTTVTITIPPTAELTVACVDRAGRPRSGARVWLAAADADAAALPAQEQDAAFTLRAARSHTNSAGLAAFEAGCGTDNEFEVRAAFGPHVASARLLGPPHEGAHTTIRVVLDGPTTRLVGTAVEASGAPLRSVPLQLQVDRCRNDARTTTDDEGRFSFELAQQNLRGRTAALHELLGGTIRARVAFAQLAQAATHDEAMLDLGRLTFADPAPIASGKIALPEGVDHRLTRLRVESQSPGGAWRPCRRLSASLAKAGGQFVIRGILPAHAQTYRLLVSNQQCARHAPRRFAVGDHGLDIRMAEPCTLVVHQQATDDAAHTTLLLSNLAGQIQPMAPAGASPPRSGKRHCWPKLARGSYRLQRIDTRTWAAVGPARTIEVDAARLTISW